MTTHAFTEAEKLAQVPGISYVDGPAGRRAHIDGAGLDVFELVRAHHSLAGNTAELAENYPWLSAAQIRAGLTFYAAFPEEIDRWLAEEQAMYRRLEAAGAMTPALLQDLAPQEPP